MKKFLNKTWDYLMDRGKKFTVILLVIVLIANLLFSSFLIISGFSFGIPGIASGINSIIVLFASNLISIFTLLAAVKPLYSWIKDEAVKWVQSEEKNNAVLRENEQLKVKCSFLNDQLQDKKVLWANYSLNFCGEKKPIIEIRNNYYDVTKQPADLTLIQKLGLSEENLPKQGWWESLFNNEKDTTFEIVSVSTKYLVDVLGINLDNIKYKMEGDSIKLYGITLEQLYDANVPEKDKIEPINLCFILKNKNGNISIVENRDEVVEAYKQHQLSVAEQDKNDLEKSVIEEMTKNLRSAISSSYPNVNFVDEADDSYVDLSDYVYPEVGKILDDLYSKIKVLKQGSKQTSKILDMVLSHKNKKSISNI